ncbi:MAG: hypothetical protein AAF799_03790 [Myxococcota bacterium]
MIHGRATLMLLLVWGAACTRVSDRSRFEAVSDELEILASAPRPGALGVDPEVRVDLCLSGRIDPRSVTEIDATITSGSSVTDTELSVQLLPWLEPGTDLPPEDTSTPWCNGSVLSIAPKITLAAGAQYRLRLRPSPVGWEGETLSTEGPLWTTADDGSDPRYILEFTIDSDPFTEPPLPGEEEDPPTPALTLTNLFAPGGPFDPERALCSCHLDSESLAFERLDLTDPTVAYADLLGSAELRDTGFPMVAPRDPSQSFLLQKLMHEDDDALLGVLGDPMPPDDPLAYLDLLRIVQWISDGAEP